jgi:hypothetical protein
MQSQVADGDRVRIATHILAAERAARGAERPRDPLRALVRALLLDELAAYRREGRFPRNVSHPGETPIFVDDVGVPCAVAHLLNASGAHAVTERIARTRNTARVMALANEPALVAWLDAAGLSLAEAAAIQPSYPYAPADCLCGTGTTSVPYFLPADGVLDAHVVQTSAMGDLRVVVDATHGDVGAYAVGQELALAGLDGSDGASATTSQRVLVLVDAQTPPRDGGFATLQAISVNADGEWECRYPDSPVASLETTVSALTAPSCWDALGEVSPAWTKRVGGGRGCGVTHDPTNGTLAILLAIVTVIASRRRRARRAMR